MIDSGHLREYVVRPTLKRLTMWSQPAEDLMMGTIAQESAGGKYLRQIRGPAIGICQMEPATHDLVWAWLDKPSRAETRAVVSGMTLTRKPEEMAWNLMYSVAMARILYRSIPHPIPQDLRGQASYYKRWYNSPQGKATESEYMENFERLVRGVTA